MGHAGSMTNRNQIQLTLRVDPGLVAALDKIAKAEGRKRGSVLREAVELRVSLDAQARLLREAVAVAASDEVRRIRETNETAMLDLLDMARATDQTHRQLLADFLDALASHGPATPPTSRGGKVVMPPRPER